MRCDGEQINIHTPGNYLRATLNKLDLERENLGWYEATRHTFASRWVLGGGSIEKLKEILGHYSVVVTERYTHLRTDLFAPKDLGTIALDLKAGSSVPVQIGPTLGPPPPMRARKAAIGGGKNRSSCVSRVLFLKVSPQAVHIRLGRKLLHASISEQPGSVGRTTLASLSRSAPLLALAPGGVCLANQLTLVAVRSYRTVSPLPRL